jgi:hypothetical protein
MRRRDVGRGAAPAGPARKPGTRAAPGLRPGPIRVPARSSLKARSASRCATKARPGADQTSAKYACAIEAKAGVQESIAYSSVMPGRSAGHSRISAQQMKTWMAGTSPVMTRKERADANDRARDAGGRLSPLCAAALGLAALLLRAGARVAAAIRLGASPIGPRRCGPSRERHPRPETWIACATKRTKATA